MLRPVPNLIGRRRRAIVVPDGVRVVSVVLWDNTAAAWTFDSPVTVTAELPVPQLWILTPGGWRSAVTLGQIAENAVDCDYDDGLLAAGQTWAIDDPPENLDFAGRSLLLPQTGLTTGGDP